MFSIIIPIYNVQDYLADCLETILHQVKDVSIECFLVDDGSIDQSGVIAKEYAERHSDVFKYLKKENGGLSDARNYAIPYAKHEYTFFIDSDDYISENTFYILASIIEKQHPDLIIFDYCNTWDDKKKVIELSKIEEGIISKKDYLMMNPSAWNKVIKTSILKEYAIQFPKGLWYEDRATTGNYVNYCQSIYYCKHPLYFYRQRENSIMQQQSYNPKMMDITNAMNLFDSQVSDKQYKEEKEYLFISNLLFQHALRVLPLKRYKELEECYMILQKRYPMWRKNKYFLKQSRGYKILCLLISRHHYTLARWIMEYRLRGGE